MSIQVKFFASLRELVGISQIEVEAASVKTVAEVWSMATNNRAMPLNTLMAVNMEYMDSAYAVKDGDEVAFFPPVTGG
jgi:molybdopterin synthase sulfur carrier subunit